MLKYSFVSENNFLHYIHHPFHSTYHNVRSFYQNNNQNTDNNINNFLSKIISSPNINIAFSILNKETKKNILTKSLPKDILKHTKTILINCTENDFREKISLYKDSLF